MPFTFAGTTIVAPGILVRTIIGAQKALALLPFGTICFIGASDGGLSNGTVYHFTDYATAQRVLRSGPLLKAIQSAINGGGGAGGFVCVVAGVKTAATLALGSANATLTSGDTGTWNNSITYTAVPGTTSGFAVTLTYPDPTSGQTFALGGPGTIYDNLATYSALRAAILADSVATPPAPFVPIVALTVTTDGPIVAASTTPLAGGTGGGATVPAYADVKAALDALDEVAFDIGHLVGIYDAASQAYANGKAQAHEIYGYLQRWIHQVRVPGANAANLKAVNSSEVANAGIAAASAMNYYRANVVAQQVYAYDPNTGSYGYVDLAPMLCGLAAYIGATGQWGPATPLTHCFLATAADVDYPVLRTNGDQDRAITGGVILVETIGTPAPGNVRIVRSVTTQPINPATGITWVLSEFSCLRSADAVLANVKAEIDTTSPRAIGGGNTNGVINSLIAGVVNILELAIDNQWIIGYDPASITITPAGTIADADLIAYSAAVTPPLNYVGVSQTLLPFQASLSA